MLSKVFDVNQHISLDLTIYFTFLKDQSVLTDNQLRLEGGGRRVKLLSFSVLTYVIENFIGNQDLFTELKNT